MDYNVKVKIEKFYWFYFQTVDFIYTKWNRENILIDFSPQFLPTLVPYIK